MMKCMVAAVASAMIGAQPAIKGTLSALELSLRTYRTEQAFQRSLPVGRVFGDKLLHNIALSRPTTLKQLLTLRGMGSKRCKSYGKDLIKIVGIDASSNSKSKPRSTPRPRPRPRPKPAPRPKPRPHPAYAAPFPTALPRSRAPASVYILELDDGRVYVGSSTNVERRIAQHLAGTGSAYTRVYKPTGVRLPRLGDISGSGDAAERDETLRYMYQRGIPFVRGWKFTQTVMPPEEFDEAEANIRESFDLCRRCGGKGHFCSQCRATYDRWGKLCNQTTPRPQSKGAKQSLPVGIPPADS